MQEIDIWERVKIAADNLGVPAATFRTWKRRGHVSHVKAIDIYQSLAGTEFEIPLDMLRPKSGSQQ